MTPHLCFYDLPGCSTENEKKGVLGEEYLTKYSLLHFDLVILVIAVRESSVASYIYQEVKNCSLMEHKPEICVLRTKIDEVRYFSYLYVVGAKCKEGKFV